MSDDSALTALSQLGCGRSPGEDETAVGQRCASATVALLKAEPSAIASAIERMAEAGDYGRLAHAIRVLAAFAATPDPGIKQDDRPATAH